MKTNYLLAVAAMFLTAAGAARAAEGPYVASSVGAYMGTNYDQGLLWTLLKGDADRKFNGSLAAGYRFDNIRVEVEGGFGRLADVDRGTSVVTPGAGFQAKGDLTVWTALAGAYYDVPVTEIYQPYLGVGGGLAGLDNSSDLLVINEGTHGAAFAEAGLNMVIYDGLTVAPGYRYLWVNSKGGGARNLSTHIVKLTARASF
ncbi:outer membrane beta-barrel protein [Niveispirillum lacus]|uniref:outer membrane beta-barrel protein n=1 Tax=Niveispirillum lacus TaxID=1981099 RepID=UPI0013FE2447|nr:outer membrane beta-barrel protein [Niveispirillum lacus]